MRGYLQAELLKQKRGFELKLLWLVPLVTLALSFLLVGSTYVYGTAFNWWYILFLPFLLLYVAASSVKKEKKWNYHGLFAIASDKKKIWYAKIAAATVNLFLASMIFSAAVLLFSLFMPSGISPWRQMLAVLLLAVTFAWQIPFFMYVTEKMGQFFTVLMGVILNFCLASILAVKSFWWIPFAIPARLMCPVIGVLPNGLYLDPADSLAGSGCILPGVLITIILYIAGCVVTAGFFAKKEV